MVIDSDATEVIVENDDQKKWNVSSRFWNFTWKRKLFNKGQKRRFVNFRN